MEELTINQGEIRYPSICFFGRDVIELKENGEIYVHGKQVAEDRQVYDFFKAVLSGRKDEFATLQAEKQRLTADNDRLYRWVSDLQRGTYVNCVYCGHRYGPDKTTPTSMADVLKQHVEKCPKHPMSALKAENERLKAELAGRDKNV